MDIAPATIYSSLKALRLITRLNKSILFKEIELKF